MLYEVITIAMVPSERRMIVYDTDPEHYNHWKLAIDGPIATLTLDVAEDKGLMPGYKLKLNSYDLGVDIELHDAMNRIVITSYSIHYTKLYDAGHHHLVERREDRTRPRARCGRCAQLPDDA